MNNDLRWRKWPEEKPQDKEKCVVFTDNSTIDTCSFDGPNDEWIYYNYCCHYESSYGGKFRELEGKVTHWLPLSALPKVEGL